MLPRASLLAFVATAAVGIAFPWGRALPTVSYKIPPSMLQLMAQDDGCTLPAGFDIAGFLLWAPDPASNNTNSPIISFGYSDKTTNITTICQYNNTSINVGPEGLTPRYACDNQIVQFIWNSDKNSLTVVEKACPDR